MKGCVTPRFFIPSFLAFALILITSAVADASTKPRRIVSLNLCLDQLVLMLAEPSRIAATSILSRQKENSFMAEAAKTVAVVSDRAEAVLALQPDLVLMSPFEPTLLKRMLTNHGLKVETLAIPRNFNDTMKWIAQVGQLINEKEKADQIITRMRMTLGDTDRNSAGIETANPLVAIFHPNGHTLGADTYEDDILRAAGFRNLAGKLGIRGAGTLRLEQIILHQPAALVFSHFGVAGHSLAEYLLRHPALVKGNAPRLIQLPSALWTCPGPMALDAIQFLKKQIQ